MAFTQLVEKLIVEDLIEFDGSVIDEADSVLETDITSIKPTPQTLV